MTLSLSGDRIHVSYAICGAEKEALGMARDICIEQTVEFPEDLIKRADIRKQIFGNLKRFYLLEKNRYIADIDYPIEAAGNELTQLLNVLFGNISLKPGIKLLEFELPPSLSKAYRGPRFGRSGLRALLNISSRPLLCTALKPMGLAPLELAESAHRFALGGIDLIKDDHGLANQSFCGFQERVNRVGEAVRSANELSNNRTLYLPNVTANADEIMSRAELAKNAGAGGIVISPGLVGFDAMRAIADNDALALPVFCHPALLGSFTVSPKSGISHGALYGTINRLAGADACIFPSFGGRFTFSKDQCRKIASCTEAPLGKLRSIFPVPAGGMRLDTLPQLMEFYGRDVILLIGGDLHRQGDDLVASCADFLRIVESLSASIE